MTKFFTVSSLACCLALSWSIGYAQTTTKTIKPYAYSMKVTVSRPKGSSAEASLKDKTKPSTTALTPCTDLFKRDVLSFDLLYDAGNRKYDKKNDTTTSSVSNVYVFFYNPEALGIDTINSANATPSTTKDISLLSSQYPEFCEVGVDTSGNILYQACDPRLWVLDRPAAGTESLAMRPLADIHHIRPNDIDHIYLAADENLGTGKINDKTLRSYMRFDDLPKGLWALVGVIWPKIEDASANGIDPSDPTTTLDLPDPNDFKDPTKWAAWDGVAFMLGSPWALPKTDQPDERQKDLNLCD